MTSEELELAIEKGNETDLGNSCAQKIRFGSKIPNLALSTH